MSATVGVGIGALALAWVMSHPLVTAPIAGPSRSAEHLRLLRETLTVQLDENSRSEIGAMFADGCRGFVADSVPAGLCEDRAVRPSSPCGPRAALAIHAQYRTFDPLHTQTHTIAAIADVAPVAAVATRSR